MLAIQYSALTTAMTKAVVRVHMAAYQRGWLHKTT